ncbi:hypothetical protein CLW00_109193 [Mongoliibacter ruber]|uniref:Uncharacterized protein n=1 Tax=Mongoliibacter ruber TaxID=1750599 RepID=A0A2T0WI66_9BACT|nr:hypothetical protein CLW00_109193 [Mongoliibacter ruber]
MILKDETLILINKLNYEKTTLFILHYLLLGFGQ